jgi:photosystem II stability/assembly factor-like uncharacterized protein
MALAALPSNSQTLLCSTDAGLWRSTDGGAHFEPLSGPHFSRITVAGTRHPILYGLSGEQIWRSADDGSHWTQAITLDRSDVIALVGSSADARALYIGYFFPPAVYSSQDEGHSWQVVTS